MLYRYWRERLSGWIFVPLAAFLAGWSASFSTSPSAARFALETVLAYLLVFQFRLWDDLEDVGRDRLEHPERVLSRSRILGPFKAMLVLLFGVNLVAMFLYGDSLQGVWGFLLLNLVVAGSYRWLPPSRYPWVGMHVILLKYPAFVLLLTIPRAAPGLELLIAAVLVYLCFTSHELQDDRRLASMPSAGWLFGAELLLLGCGAISLLVYKAAGLRPAYVPVVLIVALLCVVAAKSGSSRPSESWNYGVFAIGLVSLAAGFIVRSS